jgi:hypothetical protein
MKKFMERLVSLPNKRKKTFVYCRELNDGGEGNDDSINIDGNKILLSEEEVQRLVVKYLNQKNFNQLKNQYIIVEKLSEDYLTSVPTPKRKLEMLKREVYDKLGIQQEYRSVKFLKRALQDVYPEDARSTESWVGLKKNAWNLTLPETERKLKDAYGINIEDIKNCKDFDILETTTGSFDVVKSKDFAYLFPM